MNLQFSFDGIYSFLDTVTSTINNFESAVIEEPLNNATTSYQDALDTAGDLIDIGQDCINDPTNCKKNAESGLEKLQV
jgi:hypothetical protein